MPKEAPSNEPQPGELRIKVTGFVDAQIWKAGAWRHIDLPRQAKEMLWALRTFFEQQ